jgi:serine/threonine protein phosphatase PrpC
VKLRCALTDAGSLHNEDAFGYIETKGEIEVAWVIDGVTGINERNILPAATDALWFVERVQLHLHRLAIQALTLPEILQQLTSRLIADWEGISKTLNVPNGYDLPACCLLMVQKTSSGWQALRLGDSFLLSRNGGVHNHAAPPSNLGELEDFLKAEARRRRSQGQYDFKTLLAEFRPQLLANRRSRNASGGYSILEPTLKSMAMPQFIDLGWPSDILLCTDGFYRCVDHYDMLDDAGFLAAANGQEAALKLLNSMREVEAADAACTTYLRFKPRDDATVLMLSE